VPANARAGSRLPIDLRRHFARSRNPARQLASAHDIHLWIGARLFAQINMALFDTYVAV
jgi:hypothetical protein